MRTCLFLVVIVESPHVRCLGNLQMVLINALGCKEGGAREIAREIIAAVPKDLKVVAVISDSKRDFSSLGNVTYVSLKHVLWGRYLRVLYEVIIYIVMLCMQPELYLNLSSYGLTFCRRTILYFHSPNLLYTIEESSFFEEFASKIRRKLFTHSLKHSQLIISQTEHIKEKIKNDYNFAPNIKTFPPYLFNFDCEFDLVKRFNFQAFYPSTGYSYKNDKFAMTAISKAWGLDDDFGLVITQVDQGFDADCVSQITPVSIEMSRSLMRSSDFLLFTSSKETLGLPILEAMKFGKPVVVPDLEYARELLGESGIYYQDCDIDSLVLALLQLRYEHEKRVEMVMRRWKSYKEKAFSWEDHWVCFTSFLQAKREICI